VEGLPGGFPVQRGEDGDVVDGPAGELRRQDVVEVFAQVDLEGFAGLHDGLEVERGRRIAGELRVKTSGLIQLACDAIFSFSQIAKVKSDADHSAESMQEKPAIRGPPSVRIPLLTDPC
jgi:hypothetical protein